MNNLFFEDESNRLKTYRVLSKHSRTSITNLICFTVEVYYSWVSSMRTSLIFFHGTNSLLLIVCCAQKCDIDTVNGMPITADLLKRLFLFAIYSWSFDTSRLTLFCRFHTFSCAGLKSNWLLCENLSFYLEPWNS